MAWDGIYRRDPSPDQPVVSEQCRQIQSKALRAFGSYAVPLGVVVDGRYGAPTADFIAEYQDRKTRAGTPLPRHPSAKRGDCDYATKVALGLIPTAVVPAQREPKAVAYSVPGTGGIWHQGPTWWTCERLGPAWWRQGVMFNTSAFLMGDPTHSYIEAINEGVAELLKLALPDPRPKVPIGYSMGADVVVQFLHAWPAERRHEIVGAVTFGSPGRPPGADETGSTSVNGGISRIFTPEWARGRELSYHIKGDMYSDAPGLLPFLYEVLRRMEASGEFLFYLFGLLTGIPVGGAGGGGLGGLGSLIGGLGGLAGGPLGGILGSLGGGMLGGLGGGLLGGAGSAGLPQFATPTPEAPPNLLGSQLLGLPGTPGTGTPGFGSLSGILGFITPGPVTSTSGPISLMAMLLNIPAIIQTLIAALEFVFTGAHGKYGGTGSAQIFNGTDAVIDAANQINRLPIAA